MPSSKPEQRPDQFPDGNGKVGDTVLVVTRRNRYAQLNDWVRWRGLNIKIRVAKIVAVGFPNEYGYPLLFDVQLNTGRIWRVPSTSNTFHRAVSEKCPVAIVLPTEQEIPPDVRQWADREGAVVVRNPACDPPQLGLRCKICLGEIVYEATTTEHQELAWWRGEFSLGRPEVIVSEAEYRCDTCENHFEPPSNVENSP